VHRRAMQTLPDDTRFQRAHLDLLARRAERPEVEQAVDELIDGTGRLWVYHWAIDYLQSEQDAAAALAMNDRCLMAFPADVDTRLKHIDLLVQLGETSRAADEVQFLVGGQTVGGFLQGETMYASTTFDAPQDQTRTALGNHTWHALTAEERERLYAIWALDAGEESVLVYLAERHPRQAPAYERMSRVALEGGHHDLALRCLDRAASLNPEDDARYLDTRGAIEWSAGRHDQALVHWQRLAREPYAEAVRRVFDLLWERDQKQRAVDLVADEIVRRGGFDPGGGGQGPAIVSHAASRIEETREYDLQARLYLAVAPAISDPWIVAQYSSRLRNLHRPEQAERFLDAVLGGLSENDRLSVLFSIASLARRAGDHQREADVLAELVASAPPPFDRADGPSDSMDMSADRLDWRGRRVQALLDLATPMATAEAVDEAAHAIAENRLSDGLHDQHLAANLLRALARAEVPPVVAAADRLRSLLGDDRYVAQRDGLTAPQAELELAVGRPERALADLHGPLDEHPAARALWREAVALLEARGATVEGCSLRHEQADHLLTYLPGESGALMARARAQACTGAVDDGVATAALAQERNPGLPSVVLDRARFLGEVSRHRECADVAATIGPYAAESTDAVLLAGEARQLAGEAGGIEASWMSLYQPALVDRFGEGDALTLAAWATAPEHDPRAEALAPALETLGGRLADDPRPDRLAAALYEHLDRADAGEAALRRALHKADHHPETVVSLVDLLLIADGPDDDAVAEARRLGAQLRHLEPSSCDTLRIDFRVAAYEGVERAGDLAATTPSMGCAGRDDLAHAEQVLVGEERYGDVIRVIDRLIAVDPDRSEQYAARKVGYVEAWEAEARKGVQR
jgi:tetratricopeptide (TPR) repeat protein